MKELHVEGLATHGSPESCAVARKSGGLADPSKYGNASHGNRETPASPVVDGTAGRAGKSMDVSTPASCRHAGGGRRSDGCD